MSQEFQMSDLHKKVLSDNRVYLLHNLYPTEVFWGALLQKEIFPDDMLDEIKGCESIRKRIETLLDRLPSRGPEAFDQFCEAVYECDHIHIYQCLKKQAGASQEALQRGYEHKIKMILEECNRDMELKEEEIREMQAQMMRLKQQLNQQTKYWLHFYKMVGNTAKELTEEFISSCFIRDEKKHIEYVKNQIKAEESSEYDIVNMCSFCDNMELMVEFLERQSGLDQNSDYRLATPKISLNSDCGSLQEQLRMIDRYLVQVTEDLPEISVDVHREKVWIGLENIKSKLHAISEHLCFDMAISTSTRERRQRLKSAIMIQRHELKEISRLEREKKEIESHISELSKESEIIKKKSPKQKELLKENKIKIELKRTNEEKIETELERLKNSVYQRVPSVIRMVSDIDNDDNALSVTYNSFEVSPNNQDTAQEQTQAANAGDIIQAKTKYDVCETKPKTHAREKRENNNNSAIDPCDTEHTQIKLMSPDIKHYVQKAEEDSFEPAQEHATLVLGAEQVTEFSSTDTSSVTKPNDEMLMPNTNLCSNPSAVHKTTKELREFGDLGNKEAGTANRRNQKQVKNKSTYKLYGQNKRKRNKKMGLASSFKVPHPPQITKQGQKKPGLGTSPLKQVLFDGSSL